MAKYLINGGKKLSGSIKVGGAKNSALKLMAAALLANGNTTLTNVPAIEDVNTMAQVLSTLGAGVEFDPALKTMTINPDSVNSFEAPYELVRKMRASILVAGPLLSRFGKVKVAIPGGCNIGSRQIDLHLKGFEFMGTENYMEHGYVHACINNGSGRLKGALIDLDFPSRGATENIMMAACLARGKTVINNAAREPEIVDLANFLKSMGADIEGAGFDCITIRGVDQLNGTSYGVMADSIEAGTFITAAALCGREVEVVGAAAKNLEIFLLKLKQVGIDIEVLSPDRIMVRAAGELMPVHISTLPYPGFPTDLQPIIAVLLATVPGVSIITENVFENRFMYVDELNRMGTNIKIDGHHAIIRGTDKLSAAPVTACDLRAGAAMVLAGLVAEGTTEVMDIYHVERGYESLDKKLASIGAGIKRVD
ncbi:MAG: UDP-N-acetylglucosamine 1-carboxyvinyltransferase [Actinomycetota bacterium]|nr:UDP-N-acetylglucosamine 1-carboxyvinyltransferase [Actinomycetota bacterium]